MEAEILDAHPNATVRLIEGGGGIFDVIVNGNTVYSKRNEPRRVFPKPGLVNERIAMHLAD